MLLIDRLAFEGRLAQTPPGEKLAVAASGLILALVLPPWPWAAPNFLAALAAALLWARIKPALFLGWLLVPAGFLASSALAIAATPMSAFPWMGFPQEGLVLAGTVSLRALAASTWLVWLAFTTPAPHLAGLMGRVPGLGVLAEVMVLVYRQIALLIKTAFAMQAAQAARLGYRDARQSLDSLGRLSAALLPRALARAQRMENGLMARNLDGEILGAVDLPQASGRFLVMVCLCDTLILLGALA